MKSKRSGVPGILFIVPLSLLLAGCTAPIGAKRSSTRAAYEQLERNALSPGELSANTLSLLHRYSLHQLFKDDPEEAVRQLHAKAVSTGERDILFSLAETSYLTAEEIRKSVKPWEARDARDYYLGAAVYSYLYLFSNPNDRPATPFQRRFRMACDFYNYGLGLALAQPKDTNGVVNLKSGKRRLPIGEIDIELDTSPFPWPLEQFEQFVQGDHFLVRGLSVRNRLSGIGAPLVAVESREVGVGLRRATGATAFLRFEGTLEELTMGKSRGALELHSAFGTTMVEIGTQLVPLETDMSVHMAYSLNQSMAWRIERLQFLSLHELIRSGVYPTQPYQRGRIPVVFVHGTFSSPVWWAEMLNTLRADPELRQRYQFWFFIYNSSAPLVVSAGKLRKGIADMLQEVDPSGTDPALQQIVVIGHSQGGLLTKLISTDCEDKLWRSISDKSLDELEMTSEQKQEVQRLFFLEAMPCVRRAVFIATPHRGSYRAGGFIRSVTRRLISMPASIVGRAQDLMSLAAQLKLPEQFERRKLTSIDGMSPKSPLLKVLAELPVAPGIKAHSIIPVQGQGEIQDGSDGVVKYASAHIEGVESEFIVRSKHSCQGRPEAIEEVRRILHVHLDQSVTEKKVAETSLKPTVK